MSAVPSHYQQAIIDHVVASYQARRRGRKYRNLVVQATAGSGKSSALRMVCEALAPLGARVDVVSFNSRVARDASARLPSCARSITLHASGKRAWEGLCGRRFVEATKAREGDGELAKDKTARIVAKLKTTGAVDRYVPAGQIGKLVSRAKGCGLVPLVNTRDPETGEVVRGPVRAGIAAPVELVPLAADTDAVWRELIALCEISTQSPGPLIAAARAVLAKSVESSQAIIDFDDMVYLPALCPDVSFEVRDVVMVDEAQDLDSMQRSMVVKMVQSSGLPSIGVCVGDRRQCQPPGTKIMMAGRVEKNIEDVRPGDRIVQYSRREGCFLGAGDWAHNSKSIVEAVSSRDYSGPMIEVSVGERKTECTPDHKWEVKWANRQSDCCVVYMMERAGRYRVGWCKLFEQKGSLHLGLRARIEGAERAWILRVFDGRTQASIYESVVACEYGLPTITFNPVKGANHLTAEAIEAFFNEVDNDRISRSAAECLLHHGRDVRFPIWTSADIEGRGRQGKTTIFETEACNLMSEMMQVPIYDGSKLPLWGVIKVKSRPYMGKVYSLATGGAHTYVADGIGTHNCIYSWRGADIDSLDRIKADLDAEELPLHRCYRCPTSHIELARAVAPEIEAAPGAIEGEIVEYDQGVPYHARTGERLRCEQDVVNRCPVHGVAEGRDDECACDDVETRYFPRARDFLPGDAVICRMNAPLVRLAYALLRARVPFKMLGKDFGRGVVDLVGTTRAQGAADAIGVLRGRLDRLEADDRKARAAGQLDDGPSPATAALRERVEVLQAVLETMDCAPGEDPGSDALCRELESLFSKEEDGVTLATIHGAKGGEWERVWVLDSDLLKVKPGANPKRAAELANLKFVSLTRSRRSMFFISSQNMP